MRFDDEHLALVNASHIAFSIRKTDGPLRQDSCRPMAPKIKASRCMAHSSFFARPAGGYGWRGWRGRRKICDMDGRFSGCEKTIHRGGQRGIGE